MKHPLLAVVVSLLLSTSAAAGSNIRQDNQQNDEVTRADLARAQERVADIQKQIESSRSALTQGQQRLRKAERDAGEIASKLRQLKVRERELAKKLSRIQTERDSLARKIETQKSALARDARHAWLLGREQQLRLWLNASDPQAIARMSRYFEYIEKDRKQRLDAFQVAGVELAQLETKVAAEQKQLDGARAELKDREREMLAARTERKKAVAELTADLRSQKDELGRRKADAAALTRLFSSVREVFRDVPPEAIGSPLKQRKGKLRWPVAGRLAAKFGSPVAEGKLTLNGIVIAANEGSDVRAVHAGRVVFSEWLHGYGQLVIIDHGDSYLSAYGYNQSLLRAVGDWVKEGDAVATVGTSGGHGNPGLYFEIRQSGEPQNPARWLRQ